MSLEKEGTKNFSINGCVKSIENALSCIENEGIEKWNDLLDKFPQNHPVLKKQQKLKELSTEEYKKILKKSKKLMNFYKKSGTLNYDSLYLLESEKDVEKLAYQIILKNKHTSEIKEILDEKSKDIETDKKELAVIMDELCIRYYYGDEIEKDYNEAVKGWEIIADYIAVLVYTKTSRQYDDSKQCTKHCYIAIGLFYGLIAMEELAHEQYKKGTEKHPPVYIRQNTVRELYAGFFSDILKIPYDIFMENEIQEWYVIESYFSQIIEEYWRKHYG